MANKNITKAELEAKIAQLEALLAAKDNAAPQVTTAPVSAPQVVITTPNTDVTVVYCSDSLGYAKVSNMELNFTRYGEKFTMPRYQFDELVGKYRSWFDRGVLAVSADNVDIAASKGVRTDKELQLTPDKLASVGKMTADQLEKLWNSITIDSHKEALVLYYKRNFIEGNAGFRDRAKVDLMNRLTNGGFDRESDELSGRYKISPTVM